jgi:hypothetical protein
MTIYKNAIGGDHQAPTAIIAASDSLHPEQADYVCDGTDDQIDIQAALDEIPTCGGRIVFLPGKYECTDTIYPKDGTTLECVYSKGYTELSGGTLDFSINCNGIEFGVSGVRHSCCVIRNMRIVGTGTTNGCAGIRLHNWTDMVRLEHTIVTGFEYGVHSTNADSLHLEGMRIVGCKNGLYTDGTDHSETTVYNGYFCECDEDNIKITGTFASLIIYGNEIYATVAQNHKHYGINITTASAGALISNNYFRYLGGGVRTEASGTIITSNSFKSMNGDAGNGVIHILNKFNDVNNNYFYQSGAEYIRMASNGHYNLITGNVFNSQYSSVMGNVMMLSTTGNIISNNFTNYGAAGINITSGERNQVFSNYSGGLTGYDITIGAACLKTLIHGNIVNSTNKINNGAGSAVDIYRNYGYTTEKSGTDTIASASTSKAVTHGLSVTPAAGDIMVTPMESLGNASFFWVDTYTSTQFTIHTNAAPGADTDFAWRAIVL